MKTKLILCALFLLSCLQSTMAQKSFGDGNNAINAGVGFGGLVWKGLSYGASYERGLSDHWGVGLHLGYSQYPTGGYTYDAFIVGARGTYHFATSAKLDLYAGAELAYLNVSHSSGNDVGHAAKTFTPVGVGVYGGLRYYVTPKFGVYGELHLSTFAIVGVGLCTRF